MFTDLDSRGRVFVTTACLYLIALIGVVGFGASSFASLYREAMTIEAERLLAVANEDYLIETFDRRHRADYEEYGRFLRGAGAPLALYLGIWAGAFGVWLRKSWLGAAALAAGGALTVAALSTLPWLYFALDQYAVSYLWIMNSAVPIAVAFVLVTILARTLVRPPSAAVRTRRAETESGFAEPA